LGINVLSCFDGISAGQLALQKAGIVVDNYFASEIDKHAIKITQKNFSNTIQLGDINEWKNWDLLKIDLIIGGSPCQGFSVAGQMLNFEDPRSKLFFTFADIIDFYRPCLFLLENVRMKEEWQEIISSRIGAKPVLINSALVSAQSRKRLYWTNIGEVSQPEDKLIYLKNIIEQAQVDESFYLNNKHAGHYKKLDQKAGCLTGGAHSGGNHSDMTLLSIDEIEDATIKTRIRGHGFVTSKEKDSLKSDTLRLATSQNYFIQEDNCEINGAAIRNQVTKRGVEEQLNIRKDGKSNCVVSSFPNKLNACVIGGAIRGRYTGENGEVEQHLEINNQEKSNTLTTVQKDNALIFKDCLQVGEADLKGHDSIKRVYSSEGKSPTLTTMGGGHREPKIAEDNIMWRRLTPIECERLQTFPDNYTEGISNSQRYKALGNSWTVDVIAHIFSYLPKSWKTTP
jgi:DNA (cytosine-5)-methyltransferase 3A